MAAPIPITPAGNHAAPFSIPIAANQTLRVVTGFAHWDGTAASGAFLPALSFYAQNGALLSRTFPKDAVAQGGVADVSYAPFPGGVAGGPCPPQPNPLGTLIAWYDFSDSTTVTLDGSGNIVSVLDKSGNGHDATQPTAARRPATTTINGLTAAHFTGNHTSSQTLQSAPFVHDPPIAWFLVATLDNNPSSPNNPKWWEAGDIVNSTTFEFFQFNGFPHFQVAGGALNMALAGPFTQQQITGQTSPSPLLRLNGADAAGGGPLGSGGMGGIAIGGENAVDIDGLTGAVCELLFYVGSLTLTQVQGIEAYLKAKWATP